MVKSPVLGADRNIGSIAPISRFAVHLWRRRGAHSTECFRALGSLESWRRVSAKARKCCSVGGRT